MAESRGGKTDANQDESELVRKRQVVIKKVPQPQWNPSLRERLIAELSQDKDQRLDELMSKVSVVGRYKMDSVAKEIMALEDEGLIGLHETQKSQSFSRYLSSPESSWFLTSIGIVAVSVALVLFPSYLLPTFLSETVMYLRYFFGAILVLFLPGYSFMKALYAIRTPFDDLTRYALVFVMSLALVILLSLILGGSPIGLETLPITIALALLIVGMLSIAIKRKFDYYQIVHHFD